MIKLLKLRKNCVLSKSSGFSLTEIMISLGILGIVVSVFSFAFYNYTRTSKLSQLKGSSDKQVNDLVEMIRGSIENYQITFDSKLATKEDLLDVKELPMAWDLNYYGRAVDCPTCQGRFGYLIQPNTDFPGLYVVTIRVTHADWPEKFRDFQFVTSAK